MRTEIRTARLVGRPPGAGDVAAMLAIYGTPEVAARLYPDARPRTEPELRAMLETDLAHWRAHGFGRVHWAERDSGELVARCGPKLAIVAGRPEVDIHWTVRPDRHRRGLASEGIEAIVCECFDALGLDSVTARARADNPASMGVAQAMGFVYERDVEHLGLPHRLYRRRRAG